MSPLQSLTPDCIIVGNQRFLWDILCGQKRVMNIGEPINGIGRDLRENIRL